jgi:hypothetical protein
MSGTQDAAADLEDDRAALAVMRLLLDPLTAPDTALALLRREDPLGVMFVLAGLENAGARARESIETGVLEHVADPDHRQALAHHLRMAQLASDPRTALVAGRLLAEITPPADEAP